MTKNNKTFYDILRVGRNAKAQEIDRAYARLRSEMQKETSVPNPRLAAMAKVAYETLSDPARRDEYDESLGILKRPIGTGRGAIPVVPVLAVLVLAAVIGAGYYFYARAPTRPPQAGGEKTLTPAELLEEVGRHLGRAQGALVSGEVRELGAAVPVGENEMATTCRGIAAGMLITVTQGSSSAKAEVARVNEELDICTLAVKGVTAAIRIRGGVPPPQEKLQAVLLKDGPAEARQVTLARSIDNAKGPAYELKTAAALPNGTPVFDAQARLVGIVTAPHDFGEGIVAVLGAARIAQARASSTAATVAASVPSAAPAPSAAPSTATSPAAGGGPGIIVEEGFTTLWKEDSRGQLIEVLDNVKKGFVGIPLAYWTLWTGRDPVRPVAMRCLVTFGEEREVVADYDQVPPMPSADGYWYCALTRFQVELDDLPVGEYHFTIFANGRAVAESAARVEKRFFTPMMKIALVLVVGMGLLVFLRRGRVVKP